MYQTTIETFFKKDDVINKISGRVIARDELPKMLNTHHVM